jgi:prepilin-type N-terminal cleavage/methylation domain-containing protein
MVDDKDRRSGFTLVETLVTLAVIALMGTVAGTVHYWNQEDEIAYEATREVLDGVKKALLGETIPHDRGVHISSGYVSDMGGLPDLNDDSQPDALWKQTPGLATSEYYPKARIRAGWNGPYIHEPDSGFLTDGWGNGLSFRCDTDGALTIKSYGADMKEGGTDLDEDIILKIKKHHYKAPLGFSFKGRTGDLKNSTFKINYPDPQTGALKTKELEMERGDAGELEFGLFVSDDKGKPLFPIGLRSITATINHGTEKEDKVIVFPIQPGMNYLGTLE